MNNAIEPSGCYLHSHNVLINRICRIFNCPNVGTWRSPLSQYWELLLLFNNKRAVKLSHLNLKSEQARSVLNSILTALLEEKGTKRGASFSVSFSVMVTFLFVWEEEHLTISLSPLNEENLRDVWRGDFVDVHWFEIDFWYSLMKQNQTHAVFLQRRVTVTQWSFSICPEINTNLTFCSKTSFFWENKSEKGGTQQTNKPRTHLSNWKTKWSKSPS